jgi:sugar transferase (PEP-CTERM system associated)
MLKIFRVFIPASIIALILLEAVLLYGCYVTGLYLAQWLFEDRMFATGFLLDENGLLRILIVVVTILLALYFNDLYDNIQVKSRLQLTQTICLSVGIAFFAQAFMGYVVTGWIVPRYTMILGSTLVLLVTPPFRFLYSKLALTTLGAERVLFLGSSYTLKEVAQGIEDKPELGLKIVGYLDDETSEDDPIPGIPRLGSIKDINDLDKLDPKIRRIVVGLTERRNRLPTQELLKIRLSGIRIEEATQLYEAVLGRVCTRSFRPSQLIFSQELGPRSGTESIQSIYCFIFAVLLIILTSPVMLLVALAVRLTSRGPILLRQSRVGRGDKVFTVYKFRSMRADAEALTGAVWATRNDPRITPIGRIIRRARLDELPQFFNVLKGEMAIAGPRPERPEFVQTLSEKIPYYRQRHCVKPGITGWAQINYKYGDTIEDTIAKLEYDLYYIKNMSISLDAYIFFHTVKTMLLSRGAQ